MKKLALFAVSSLVFVACSHEVNLQVQTDKGTIEGFELEGGVKAYLGIPFAQAPVGDLRWKAPQPKETWEGVLPTKTFGFDPIQPVIWDDIILCGEHMDEDCLYLNVWTNAKTDKDNLPVLIYFNGGGLMVGSGSEARYEGDAIAKEGVIGVTANYREGVFGFFAHPELSAETDYKGSGNYGFLDQVAAIEWVKRNIKAFGGDPNRITIAGESAGSFSVSLLMVSPLSKDMLAGAILSSGAEVYSYRSKTLAQAEQDGLDLFASKGLTSVAQARALSADSLAALLPPTGMAVSVLDGYFMTEYPDSVYAQGREAAIPLLAGWNSLESYPQARTLKEWKPILDGWFHGYADKMFKVYGIHTDTDVMATPGFNLASDLFTGFPTWKACDYHAKAGYPTYRYKFNRPRPLGDKTEPGAVHSADIEYAMGNLEDNHVFYWTDVDYAISRTFLSFYANFAKTGNPNGEGLPQWDMINGQLDCPPVMQIDTISAQINSQGEAPYHLLEEIYTIH